LCAKAERAVDAHPKSVLILRNLFQFEFFYPDLATKLLPSAFFEKFLLGD
jgi:hypothetical protein